MIINEDHLLTKMGDWTADMFSTWYERVPAKFSDHIECPKCGGHIIYSSYHIWGDKEFLRWECTCRWETYTKTKDAK